MKVLYFITGWGSGVGGHYYSLRETAQFLSRQNQNSIVNVGTVASPVLTGMAIPVHNVLWSARRLAVRDVLRRLDALVSNERPDVLHSFDIPASFFARRLSARRSIPWVHTLCGGPSPGSHWLRDYFPRVPDLIVYSLENRSYFAGNPRYRESRLHLIPNRVGSLAQDVDRIAAIRKRLDPDARIFVRVARMSPFHEASARQAIRLVQELNGRGVRTQLALIGVVQDERVYRRLISLGGPETVFFTDPAIAQEGSAILDVGEFVVGTGRGFMEGACLGKVMLAPLEDGDIPVLATPANWKRLFWHNFSARSRIDSHSLGAGLDLIRRVLQDRERQHFLATFHRRVAEKYFALAGAVGTYDALYRRLRPAPWLVTDFLRHLLFLSYFQLRQR